MKQKLQRRYPDDFEAAEQARAESATRDSLQPGELTGDEAKNTKA